MTLALLFTGSSAIAFLVFVFVALTREARHPQTHPAVEFTVRKVSVAQQSEAALSDDHECVDRAA